MPSFLWKQYVYVILTLMKNVLNIYYKDTHVRTYYILGAFVRLLVFVCFYCAKIYIFANFYAGSHIAIRIKVTKY